MSNIIVALILIAVAAAEIALCVKASTIAADKGV